MNSIVVSIVVALAITAAVDANAITGASYVTSNCPAIQDVTTVISDCCVNGPMFKSAYNS